ncbi:hypothetical protein FNH09_01570 [Streptomyces adustus]|uniref:Uncharacterized protein n=1 Tax=Streptomyces adustus TaxID=1609272 RepID=A0A5N8V624_9ACTN|nr:DUF5959 family protein [Streptomyces adustus]MPY30062.1 hypothetical protein [Streptomyces adustus]
MTEQGGVDLIRLADDEGNSVVVQVTGRHRPGVLTAHDTLTANVLVTTAFVSGQLDIWIAPRDLVEWETALDSLAAGQDISWMGGRGPEIRIQLSGERGCPDVIVDDIPGSMATVTVPVAVEEGWMEEQRRRLDEVRRRWPREVVESSFGVYEWSPHRKRRP